MQSAMNINQWRIKGERAREVRLSLGSYIFVVNNND